MFYSATVVATVIATMITAMIAAVITAVVTTMIAIATMIPIAAMNPVDAVSSVAVAISRRADDNGAAAIITIRTAAAVRSAVKPDATAS